MNHVEKMNDAVVTWIEAETKDIEGKFLWGETPRIISGYSASHHTQIVFARFTKQRDYADICFTAVVTVCIRDSVCIVLPRLSHIINDAMAEKVVQALFISDAITSVPKGT